jgi:hypothetical protein
MPYNDYRSDDEYQFETHRLASNFYSEILPLTQSDKDNFCITVRLSDDIGDIVRFTVELIDAAISGDASARRHIGDFIEANKKQKRLAAHDAHRRNLPRNGASMSNPSASGNVGSIRLTRLPHETD